MTFFKRKATGAALITAILMLPSLGTSVVSYASDEQQNMSKITLMTQNLYQGADLTPLASSNDRTAFLLAVASTFSKIQATNFPERAEAIAEEVRISRPHVIGLQEAVIIRTQVPADGPATAATNVTYDYLQILLDELKLRGLDYIPIVTQTGLDVEVPGLFDAGLMDVRLTDREAILLRADLVDNVISSQGAQFDSGVSFVTPFGTIKSPKAWVATDLQLSEDQTVRFVSTHLEAVVPAIQVLQADELLEGPANTSLPIVLLGDFNSNAEGTGTATYSNLITNGDFRDAWKEEDRGQGFTCCQDDDLKNPLSAFTTRIDLVLYNGEFEVKKADIVGDTGKEKTSSGLWPSNHGGLVVELKLVNQK